MRLANRIRSRAFAMLVIALTLALGEPASASDTVGVEVIVGAPKVFASVVSGAEDSWIVVAYHTRSGDATKVYAYQLNSPVWPAPHDQITADPSSLQIEWDASTSLWNVFVYADMPTLGRINLRLISGQGVDAAGAGCPPEYTFESPSRGLSPWGIVIGSVDGESIESSVCPVWGTDAYGYYALPPMGFGG